MFESNESTHNIQNDNNIKLMPKREIHPTWFSNTPVFFDGKLISYVGSTKQELNLSALLIYTINMYI